MVLFDYDVIREMLESKDPALKKFAVNNCRDRVDVPIDILRTALMDPYCQKEARKLARDINLSDETIYLFAATRQTYLMLAALDASLRRKTVLIPVIVLALGMNGEVFELGCRLAAKFNLPASIVLPALKKVGNDAWAVLLSYYENVPDIDPEIIVTAIRLQACDFFGRSAVDIFMKMNLPEDVLRKLVESHHPKVRAAALRHCLKRKIEIELKPNDSLGGRLDYDSFTLLMEMLSAGLVKVTKEQLKEWSEGSETDKLRLAACMNSDKYYDEDLAMKCLEEAISPLTCKYAADAIQERSIIRSFEPPKTVYQKCHGGVIVVGKIPADANVYGDPDKRCVTDKVKITKVIGKFYGKSVGISKTDFQDEYTPIEYVKGGSFEFANFSWSNGLTNNGFHFYCTQAQAEKEQ